MINLRPITCKLSESIGYESLTNTFKSRVKFERRGIVLTPPKKHVLEKVRNTVGLKGFISRTRSDIESNFSRMKIRYFKGKHMKTIIKRIFKKSIRRFPVNHNNFVASSLN